MSGKARLITVIPVGAADANLARTLDSLRAQTPRPDRVLIVSYGAPDRAPPPPAPGESLPIEWRGLGANHSFLDACNIGLGMAANTRHLHLLRAGDVVRPGFYASLLHALGDGDAFALAFCLQESVDAAGRRLWVAGWRRRRLTVFSRDAFLRRMMGLQPLPLSTALLRTGGHRLPARFRVEISQIGHKQFWAAFGAHCVRIVRVNQPLCVHACPVPLPAGPLLPGMQPLVYDELRVMRNVEAMLAARPGWWGRQRMMWIFSRRAALKARRARQLHKPYHAREIARAARSLAGWWRWVPARWSILLRDWLVFGVLRRRRDEGDLYR